MTRTWPHVTRRLVCALQGLAVAALIFRHATTPPEHTP